MPIRHLPTDEARYRPDAPGSLSPLSLSPFFSLMLDEHAELSSGSSIFAPSQPIFHQNFTKLLLEPRGTSIYKWVSV
jgi:hypothetical protein